MGHYTHNVCFKTDAILRLFLVWFAAIVIATTTVSAGRPQCADVDHPGSCFFDDMGIVGAVRYSPAGDAYVALWPGNDFFQIRPDGTSFGVAASNDVSLYVCPKSAGGAACINDFFDTNPDLVSGAAPELVPGMLAGTNAHVDNTGVFDDSGNFLCPNVLHVRGTVFDESGTSQFSFTDDFQLLTDPGQQGCRIKVNEIEIDLE